MTLNEKIAKQVISHIEKNEFQDACRLLRRRYNYLAPAGYNYLLTALLMQMVIALSSKGHYLTSETYQLVTSLPLHPYDAEPSSVMERTNRLYQVVKNQTKNYRPDEKQKSIQFE